MVLMMDYLIQKKWNRKQLRIWIDTKYVYTDAKNATELGQKLEQSFIG